MTERNVGVASKCYGQVNEWKKHGLIYLAIHRSGVRTSGR